MTPQQEQHDFLAKFLKRFGTFVILDELRIDADPSSKVRLVTNDEEGEEQHAPISIGGRFSTIELIKFQGRPAVMKTMKNTRAQSDDAAERVQSDEEDELRWSAFSLRPLLQPRFLEYLSHYEKCSVLESTPLALCCVALHLR